MPKSPQIADSDVPDFARRCWQRYQDFIGENGGIRDASDESKGMYAGGQLQWRDGEVASRKSANRPIITINRCKPIVDQIANETEANPPGPQALPVGGGADKDGADVLEGLIREYEYRAHAQTSYAKTVRDAAAGNMGVFELATEYAGERTFSQRLTVKMADDVDAYFTDPDARMPARQDAMWGGKIRVLSREKLIEEYGEDLYVLKVSNIKRAAGWMSSAMRWTNQMASLYTWTGSTVGGNEGPYYVCEFYMVRIEPRKLTEYSNHLSYYEDEAIPEGVTPKLDDEGRPITRKEPQRKVYKYVVTALDTISKTEWLGTIIPHFWVLGPEIWIKGKLYRQSAIDGAIGSQRGLNYTVTSAAEVVGAMTKSPWVGWVGQFDVANAQGINPWDSSNTRMWNVLEVKPTFAAPPEGGPSQLLPAPQRNTWEAPIARLMELANFFGEQIKAASAVFFDPTTQSAAAAESGEAIKALQSQTNIGTANWQAALHYAVSLSYGQAAIILPQIKTKEEVSTIVRADGSHEQITINKQFPGGDVSDPASGKREKTNKLGIGEYSLRVTAGPNFQVRTQEALNRLMEVLKIAPQITQAPGVLAQIVRMVGEGSPQMEQMADALAPAGDDDLTPEQLKMRIQQLQQGDQQKQMLINQLQQALLAKLPEIQAKERTALLEAAVDLAKSEMAAKNQTAARQSADQLAVMQIAHEVGTQAVENEHQQQMPAVTAAAQPEPETAGAAQ